MEFVVREVVDSDSESSLASDEYSDFNENDGNNGNELEEEEEEEEVLETFGQNAQTKTIVHRVPVRGNNRPAKPTSSVPIINNDTPANSSSECAPRDEAHCRQQADRVTDSSDPPNKREGGVLSLVEAIGRAVAAVENDESDFAQSTWTPLVDNTGNNAVHNKPTNQSGSHLPSSSSNTGSSTADDVFGIPYKPFREKATYKQPSGPAFEDELEFERELSIQVNPAVAINATATADSTNTNDNDDEFDVDFDTPKLSTDSNNLCQLDQALARAAQRAQAAALSDSNNNSDDIVTDNNSDNNETGTNTNSNAAASEQPSRKSGALEVLQAAKTALLEVTSVYGSGLGDVGVRLMEAENSDVNGQKTNNSLLNLTTTLKPGGNLLNEVIEEGDEEEEREEELREIEQVEIATTQHRALEDEWSALSDPMNVKKPDSLTFTNINTNTNDYTNANASVATEAQPNAMSFDEALLYCQSLDLSCFRDQIVVSDPSSSSSWSLLGGTAALTFPNCEEALAFPFLLAQLDCDTAVSQHLSMLQSIYKTLVPPSSTSTTTTTIVPAVGNHWDAIGFQGTDPRTDVNRSMKSFAVLQALQLVDSETSFAKQLHRLSTLVPSQSVAAGKDLSWPFMCVSIMFTKEAIQALRSGVLNKKCNKRGDVLSVLFDFHHACFFEFGKLLLSDPQTHHAQHLAAIRKLCSSKPLELLKKYTTAVRAALLNTDSNANTRQTIDILQSYVKTSTIAAAKTTKSNHSSSSNSSNNNARSIQTNIRNVPTEAAVARFDDLESIQRQMDAAAASENDADVSSSSSKPSSSNLWSAIGFGDKRDKFKAKN